MASLIQRAAALQKGVPNGADVTRVKALARKSKEPVPDLTPVFQRPGGAMKLFPVQSAALLELEAVGGLLGAIGVGHGKCLGRGTPVLLFDGKIKSVEDIEIGDTLMGPDSTPRKVLSTCRGVGPLYKVNPIKGSPWVCNDVHVLTLVDSVSGKVFDIEVCNFLQKSRKIQNESKLFTTGVNFVPVGTLPVDPYFIGVWIGDGTKTLTGISISKPDPEIFDLVQKIANRWGLKVRTSRGSTGCPTYHLVNRRGYKNRLLDNIRALFGEALVIPQEYLTATREERLALLAGMLDTDGHFSQGCFDFVQKRKDYAEAACYLARSLGLRATLSSKEVRGHGIYWRANIFGEVSIIPTRLPRKKAGARRQKKNALRTGFKLESIGEGEYFGFTLDRDGRFLLGDFTVTHNTVISLLAAEAVEAERPLLLVPPDIKHQLVAVDIPRYLEHFTFKVPQVLAYSELSVASGVGRIEQIKPDLIIADEAHCLKDKSSARTKRFLAYMRANPETLFVALSGTMTAKSLRDYAHLSTLALGTLSPLPLSWGALEDWCAALDAKVEIRAKPGALMKLCEENGHDHVDVRSVFVCRFSSSRGVVATRDSAVGTSLVIKGRIPSDSYGRVGASDVSTLPGIVREALSRLRATWTRPDGEEIEEATRFYEVASQLAQGFYLKWAWPEGKVDEEWLTARGEWHREVRAYLGHSSGTGRDTPGLVAALAQREPERFASWKAWDAVRARKPPPVECVWLSDYLVNDAAEWLKGGGIVWANHPDLGSAISLKSGLPYFGAGKNKELEAYRGPGCVLSLQAHHKGKNLQDRWARMLFTSVPGNKVLEQAIGRLHRHGQEADQVDVEVYQHTHEFVRAWKQALEQAEYVQGTQEQRQKILLGNKVDL